MPNRCCECPGCVNVGKLCLPPYLAGSVGAIKNSWIVACKPSKILCITRISFIARSICGGSLICCWCAFGDGPFGGYAFGGYAFGGYEFEGNPFGGKPFDWKFWFGWMHSGESGDVQ